MPKNHLPHPAKKRRPAACLLQNTVFCVPLYQNAKLILNKPYYGLVVVNENLQQDATFEIISENNEAVQIITDQVTIPKGKHHGIVSVEATGTGSAKIYAIHKDTLLEQNLLVVESASNPTKLDLITPSTLIDIPTENRRYPAYVFLLNEFGKPVLAKEPVVVTLTANGDVKLNKNTVTINPQEHYAKFFFETMGNGAITAAAPNLEPDESTTSLTEADRIQLKIAAAPTPIPTSSGAEIYYWLERDGKPYIAAHDIKIILNIDKSTNLSFNPEIKGAIVLSSSTSDRRATDPDAKQIITRTDVQLKQDSTRELILPEGRYYGKITVYSSFDAADSINVNGFAQSINPQEEEKIKSTSSTTVSTEKSNFKTPTQTNLFALPNPAHDKVEIIVSSHSDDGPAIERADKTFQVFVDDKLATNNTSGIIKNNENYGIVVADVKDIGTSTIFAQREETKGKEISVEIRTKSIKNPDITLTRLPVIFGVEQDLLVISSSHDQFVTNPDLSGENLVTITSRPSFEYELVDDKTSVITVRGIISSLLDEDPVVHVVSNAFTASVSLDVYNPARKKIESMHPNSVYVTEEFPIINHVTDIEGNPMDVAELKISSSMPMGKAGNLFYLNQSGTQKMIIFEKNTTPQESTIEVKGGQIQPQIQQAELQAPKQATFEYVINVINGEGSGRYAEGTNVTISAPPVLDDIFIIKKKLVGWQNLPYREPTVTFSADFDVETAPIYQYDYTMLFVSGGGAAGAAALVVINKKIKKNKTDDEPEEILE